MKEILYIQAGTLANHIGTHFWNTQESYFTYEEGEDPIVTHDISFREGLTRKDEPTFCPRVLIFDRKANFGTLSPTSGLYGDKETDALEVEQSRTTWNGNVVEYRQDSIPKSSYHTHLEEETAYPEASAPVKTSNIRYWSDYSRVYFHPRSLQKLPDHADWESLEGDWNAGREEFARHDSETSLMEDSFRLFVEECDALQGVQLTHDTATFGGFTNAFLTSFRDEFAKLPCFSFPLLSDSIPGSIDQDDAIGMRKALNDALCLRNLNEICDLSIPLQAPSTWTLDDWLEGLSLSRTSMYDTSALLSSHIETATLPLRLRGTQHDILSICSALNASGSPRFSHLSGVLPLSDPFMSEHDMKRLYDFSTSHTGRTAHVDRDIVLSRFDVSRGLTAPEVQTYDIWTELRDISPYIVHAPAYPLPSSFPTLCNTASPSSRARSARLLSSLTTTSSSAHLFAKYATLVEDATKRHTDVTNQMGLEADELRELKDELWAICDAFPEGNAGQEDLDGGEE
ncbi:mtDNA inheritance protein Dml1 [Obba rivulosa]|uniref:MtDNA inheritance protein Dml1 n=1 Tax=Obba rivulosa TaxID=1052685 RepID=A0A8E2AUP1_9APHY|nr:mtDNA inheritance protein Dml1 [Obba rivulosa]